MSRLITCCLSVCLFVWSLGVAHPSTQFEPKFHAASQHEEEKKQVQAYSTESLVSKRASKQANERTNGRTNKPGGGGMKFGGLVLSPPLLAFLSGLLLCSWSRCLDFCFPFGFLYKTKTQEQRVKQDWTAQYSTAQQKRRLTLDSQGNG